MLYIYISDGTWYKSIQFKIHSVSHLDILAFSQYYFLSGSIELLAMAWVTETSLQQNSLLAGSLAHYESN